MLKFCITRVIKLYFTLDENPTSYIYINFACLGGCLYVLFVSNKRQNG